MCRPRHRHRASRPRRAWVASVAPPIVDADFSRSARGSGESASIRPLPVRARLGKVHKGKVIGHFAIRLIEMVSRPLQPGIYAPIPTFFAPESEDLGASPVLCFSRGDSSVRSH